MLTLFDNDKGNRIRIIVAGGRNYNDYTMLSNTLTNVLESCGDAKKIIISGCCQGADALGEQYAKIHGIPIKRFPAEWMKYGKAAGPIRNRKMATYASEGVGVLVAFWDGKSRGTESMIWLAKKYGLQTIIVKY